MDYAVQTGRSPFLVSSPSSGSDEAKPEYARRPHDDHFPPDSPWASLHRASHYAARPPTGGRLAFAPVHWPDVFILLATVAACWCVGQFAPPPWIDALSLTLARVVVAIIGVVIGVACGYALVLRIGRRIYAATMYATLTHSEMSLSEIDRCAEPGPVAALHLLRWRMLQPAVKRSNRPYDTRPWAVWLIYFLGLSLLGNLGSFLYARTVIIYTQTVPQTSVFFPLPVLGELSVADLDYALEIAPTLQSSQTAWTFAAPASFGAVPSPASLAYSPPNGSPSTNNRTVFFTDASPRLFSSSSVGPAASLWKQFLKQNSGSLADRTLPTDDATQGEAVQGAEAISTGAHVPVAVDFPAWGSEVRCSSLRDLGAPVTIAPDGGAAWTVPVGGVRTLMTDLSLDVSLLSRLNTTGGTITPPSIPGDGVALFVNSTTLDAGDGGAGYVVIDWILVRVDAGQAPDGRFLSTATVTSPPSTVPVNIGVDGAVCVTHISPFIVRAIDTDGVTTLTSIVSTGPTLPPLATASQRPSLSDAPTQPLSSTNKSTAFLNAYGSARNSLLKDNGPLLAFTTLSSAGAGAGGGMYAPNPTVVQMGNVSTTAPTMPSAYGALDSAAVELVMAGAQARFLLPYLVGQGRVDGRAYPFASVAYAYVETEYLALLMGLILLLGLLGAFFVPRPPFNLPLRDLNVSNWLAFADQVPEAMFRDEEARVDRGVKLRYGK